MRLNCFKLFVSLNTRRADPGLPQFSVAPVQPVFSTNPVKELAYAWTEGKFTLLARVEGTPEQLILVQGARPVGSGVQSVQHFPLLGLLPPPKDGWSNLTDLYVARYGVPKPNQAVWIRFCQHIDGFIDAPAVGYISLSLRQCLAPFPLTEQHPHRYLPISSPYPHRTYLCKVCRGTTVRIWGGYGEVTVWLRRYQQAAERPWRG